MKEKFIYTPTLNSIPRRHIPPKVEGGDTLDRHQEESLGDCPVCAARREKEKLRKRRWRGNLKKK